MPKTGSMSEAPMEAAVGLDALYDEALALAYTARDYALAAVCRQEVDASLDRLIASRELSRVTARLGFCIAWLLTRRAVLAGELTPAQAREESWRLGGQAVCLDDGEPCPAELPPRLRSLMAASDRLYRRIARLDHLLETAS